jgi:hypothetical protein
MVSVTVGDTMLHSVIAISHFDASLLVKEGDEEEDEEQSEAGDLALLTKPICGFYHAGEVDDEKSLITLLSPNNTRFAIGKVCLMGALKWVETK